MILADTSVWIDHLRGREQRLPALLDADQVLMHPFVVGELACGNLQNRQELLLLWERLPLSPVATHADVLRFVEWHRLMGLGLGYVDAHLLAATALAGTATFWTKDRRLSKVAKRLQLAHETDR